MSRARAFHLTPIQERIVAYIRDRIDASGDPPTLAEIGDRFGLSSRATVHYHLQKCVEKGAIVRDPRRPRAIRLT